MNPTLLSRLHAAASLIFKSGAPFPFNKIMPYDATGGEKMYRPYEQSTWVMRAIKKISGPIAAVDLRFANAGRRYADPAVDAFWANPAAGLSRHDFIEATVGWLKLEGEAFWILDDSWLAPFHNFNSKVANSKLIVARPDRMRHVVKNGGIVGWDYVDAAGDHALLLPEQVIHTKMWNPYNDWRGLAELKPCRDAAEADYLAGKFNLNLMRNNGDQGVYIVAKNGIPVDAQRQQIIDQIREKRELAQRGVFKPVFLGGDVTIEDPKIRVPDEAFNTTRLQNRHEIYIAMGVPASMADVTASFSIGSASDWFMLISETCIPTGDKICQSINQVLRRQTGLNLAASFNWDEHPVIQAVRRERADTAKKYFKMGVPLQVLNTYLDLELPECPDWQTGHLPSNLTSISVPPSSVAPDTIGTDEDTLTLTLNPTPNPLSSVVPDNIGAPPPNLNLSPNPTLTPNPIALDNPRHLIEHISRLKAALAIGPAETVSSHPAARETVNNYESKFNKVLFTARAELLAKLERYSKSTLPSAIASAKADQPVTKSVASDFLFNTHDFTSRLSAALRPVTEAALQTAGAQPGQAAAFLKSREPGIAEISAQIHRRLSHAGNDADAVRACFNEIAKRLVPRFAAEETNALFAFARDAASPPSAMRGAKLIRTLHPEVRIVDARLGIVDYIASDESIDSYREIIRASGWRFTHFAKNAPFVDSHDYSTIEKCVGKVVDFRVEGRQLIERVQWAIDVPENKLAQIGWKMTQAGYLKAVSVGFTPVKYLTPDSGAAWAAQLKELGLPADAPVRAIYTEQEQLELSCCIIGSNPNALAKAYKAGAIDDADIETLSVEFSQRENARAADSPAPAARACEQARLAFLEKLQNAISQL